MFSTQLIVVFAAIMAVYTVHGGIAPVAAPVIAAAPAAYAAAPVVAAPAAYAAYARAVPYNIPPYASAINLQTRALAAPLAAYAAAPVAAYAAAPVAAPLAAPFAAPFAAPLAAAHLAAAPALSVHPAGLRAAYY